MVHNLRSRNICGTSAKLRSRNNRRYVVNNPNNEMPHDQSTPLVYTPSESLLGEVRKCSNRVIPTTSTPRRLRTSFLTSTRIDHAVVRSDSGVFSSMTRSESEGDIAPTTRANLSSYERNIFSVVDEAIFSKTYRTAKGLSLRGIRNVIREFGYDPKKCQKKVRLYVRESIENCKFVQLSGRGANGTFRLNKSLHRSFIKAHKTGRISKNRNVSSSNVYRKRFMQHDLDMLDRM